MRVRDAAKPRAKGNVDIFNVLIYEYSLYLGF